MTIETKHNIGDKVWLNSLGHHIKGQVDEINISVLIDGSVHIIYSIEKSGYFFERHEDELFSTKEKAEKCIEDLGGQQYWTSFSDQVCPQYYIEEWEVDRND